MNFIDSSGRAKKATQSLAGNSYSAAISKTKTTDGGNSQREAAIYGGGSSSAGAKARDLARANAVLANTYAPGSKAAQQAQINYSNTVKQTTSGSKSSYTGSNTTYTPVPSKSSAAASQNVNNAYYNAVCNGGKNTVAVANITKVGEVVSQSYITTTAFLSVDSELLKQAYRGKHTVTNAYAFEDSIISIGSKTLALAAVGAGIDYSIMRISGETIASSFVKTVINTAIGVLIGVAIGALVASGVGIGVAILAGAISAVASVKISDLVDATYDNSDIKKTIDAWSYDTFDN